MQGRSQCSSHDPRDSERAARYARSSAPPSCGTRNSPHGAVMILERLDPTPAEFGRATGWELKPEGACKAEVCIPLPKGALRADGRVDVPAVADALGMGFVADEDHGLWALGPVSGGR